jgi:DNA-binding NarL/FixJ family response regulator
MTTLSTPPRTGFELANGRSSRRASSLDAAGGPEAVQETDRGPGDPSAAGETETRIVVIDDHAVVRDALVTVLSETSGLKVVGAATTLREGIAIVKQVSPDVVVADMSLTDGNATDLLRVARRQHLRAKIVVLTGLDDQLAVAEAIREGAAGYVLKMQPVADLIAAIRAAAAGESYVSPALGGDAGGDWARSGLLKLSRREGEIFRLSIRGDTAKEIARKLFLSCKTVETHRGNINRKLGVRTTADMTRVAALYGVAIAPKLRS